MRDNDTPGVYVTEVDAAARATEDGRTVVDRRLDDRPSAATTPAATTSCSSSSQKDPRAGDDDPRQARARRRRASRRSQLDASTATRRFAVVHATTTSTRCRRSPTTRSTSTARTGTSPVRVERDGARRRRAARIRRPPSIKFERDDRRRDVDGARRRPDATTCSRTCAPGTGLHRRRGHRRRDRRRRVAIESGVDTLVVQVRQHRLHDPGPTDDYTLRLTEAADSTRRRASRDPHRRPGRRRQSIDGVAITPRPATEVDRRLRPVAAVPRQRRRSAPTASRSPAPTAASSAASSTRASSVGQLIRIVGRRRRLRRRLLHPDRHRRRR